MAASRVRVGSALEWLFAAACAAAGVVTLSVAITQMRGVRPVVVPVTAAEAPLVEPPAGLPPRAASVPLLLLNEGREVHLGDRLADVASRLRASSQLLSESKEDLPGRRRVTRLYNDVGTQFVIVFDGAEAAPDLRVSAIFVR